MVLLNVLLNLNTIKSQASNISFLSSTEQKCIQLKIGLMVASLQRWTRFLEQMSLWSPYCKDSGQPESLYPIEYGRSDALPSAFMTLGALSCLIRYSATCWRRLEKALGKGEVLVVHRDRERHCSTGPQLPHRIREIIKGVAGFSCDILWVFLCSNR